MNFQFKVLSVFAVMFVVFAVMGCANKNTYDRDGIRNVIRNNLKNFQTCYNIALKESKNVNGKIDIFWQIVDGGKAEKVSVKNNSTGDEKLGKCIANEVGKLTYPLPPHNKIAEVKYPFIFTSDSNTAAESKDGQNIDARKDDKK